MEIVGAIKQIMPIQNGMGAKSPWTKQEFVIETQDKYPKQVVFQDFNDKCGLSGYTEGQLVEVTFSLESREYNNRFYTNVNALSMRVHGENKPAAPQQPRPAQTKNANAMPSGGEQFMYTGDESESDSSSLPF